MEKEGLKFKSSFEEAYSLILDDIFNGKLRPGEVVTEADLAVRYGISRTPVREALSRFQCEGLINTTKRTKRIYTLSPDDVEEIFELKKLIEGELARKAAENLTSKQAESLRSIVDGMKLLSERKIEGEDDEKEVLKEWLALDMEFHELIYGAAGNSRADMYINKLNIQWHRLKVGLIAIEGRISKAIIEHTEIAKAIIDRDSDLAGEAMRSHLESLCKVLIKLMMAFGYSDQTNN